MCDTMSTERALPVDEPGRASFVLSLDTELIWGSFHQMSPTQFEAGYPDVRSTIRAILAMLDEYEIAATWAVVGHLFLERCERDAHGRAHPDIVHPRQSYWQEDWYSRDPCTSRDRDHLWYGPDILDMIQAARVPQEIGSHSFAHPRFGDPEFTREAAVADLDACLAAARSRGIELRSFVFPANSEGFHELLRERGFRAYRGTGPEEDRVRRLPGALQRPVRLATQALGTTPLNGRPVERLPGLWDIPASMLLLTRSGLRKLSTHQARVRRVRNGIESARRRGAVFHLWTHPWNLADDPRFHQAVLRDILEDVTRLRDTGAIRIETMGGMATRLSEPSREG
jgi:peptidoglycan/xylan/chitin deacetylase (PgdA/CDA1 family)